MSLSIKKPHAKRQIQVPTLRTAPTDGPGASGVLIDVLHDAEGGLLALALRLGLQTLQQLMAAEVDALVGPKGQHNAGRTAVRHGFEEGYVYIGDRKVPVTHPRVRTTTGDEVPMTTYQAFQDPAMASQAVLERLLFGLASRQQHHADPTLNAVVAAAPPSKSTVSRRFIQATRQALDTFMARRLDDRTWVVLMIDGIRVGRHLVVVALGIDQSGHKQILGLAEGATENSTVVKSLLTDLVERGFAHTDGVLAVIDGSKALAKALQEVFGDTILIQRCILHKIRNVLDHVPESAQSATRHRLRKAYQEPDAAHALKQLKALAQELAYQYPQAAKSLQEGMEETVTVQRLQLPGALRQALATTNALESINSQFRTHAKNVKRWSSGDQVLRWLASASLYLEDGLRRIPGYRDLPVLQTQLRTAVGTGQSLAPDVAAS